MVRKFLDKSEIKELSLIGVLDNPIIFSVVTTESKTEECKDAFNIISCLRTKGEEVRN